MFNKKELVFIKDLLEEELIDIEMEKLCLEDEIEIMNYDNITKPRREYIEKLLDKLNKGDKNV